MNTQVARFDREVSTLAARLASTTHPVRPVVIYGSSTVRLWQAPQRDLAREDVVTVGFGGAQLADLEQHYGRLVAPLAPATLVIAAGANDLDSTPVGPADLVRRMCTLVATARAHDASLAVLVLTLKPSPQLDPLLDRILAANAALAARFSPPGEDAHVRLVDTCTPFVTSEGRADARYYAQDRRHMNAAGYARWSACLAHALPALQPHP